MTSWLQITIGRSHEALRVVNRLARRGSLHTAFLFFLPSPQEEANKSDITQVVAHPNNLKTAGQVEWAERVEQAMVLYSRDPNHAVVALKIVTD